MEIFFNKIVCVKYLDQVGQVGFLWVLRFPPPPPPPPYEDPTNSNIGVEKKDLYTLLKLDS